MKPSTVILLLLLALAVLFPANPAAAAKSSYKLKIAYVAPIGVMAPLWMAADSSAFRHEGLEVESLYIRPNAAMAALIAGEIDGVEVSAPAVVPAVLAGANLTMIAGLLNKMIFSLHAQKEIKSANQLRGKIVGTDRAGTPANYGGRTALTKIGLKPESDVRLLALGGSAILWPALQSKQIAASTLTPPQSFLADARGFTRLADTYDLPYQNVAIVIRKDDVENRSNVWEKFLRAIGQGIEAWYRDPKLAVHVLARYTHETEPEMLQKTYEFFSKQAGFNRDLTVSDQGIDSIVQFLGATVLPGAKGVAASRFYDMRILERIRP